MESAWVTYIQTALTTYKAKFGIGRDLEAFLKSGIGDFKTAFIAYKGFIVPGAYEDGGFDVRLHEFNIYLTSKYSVITDVETLIDYIKSNRTIKATGLTLSIGNISGNYVYTDSGYNVFEISIICTSTDKF